MVKEFDPLEVTQAGEATIATQGEAVEPPATGMYAGRYQIEQMVGRGGMGTVYRAVDVMVGDVVALKVLDATLTAAKQQLEWFKREVRLARKITHPNVARTHDMGEQNGAHFITMEFIEGTTLQELLRVREGNEPDEGRRKRQALEPARAARIAWAVAEGLAAAHAAGVVHRDLKPANVLIERSGRVVLTDFGIARGLGDEAMGARTQGVVGTPLYMAPEQLTGAEVDVRADLYALGLMLFEMLTGQLPFAGETTLAAALARLTQPPPDPRKLAPAVPGPLAELVLQLLAQKPDERPAGAPEVAERLRGWLVACGESLAAVPTAAMVSAVMSALHGSTVGPSGGASSNMTPTQQQLTEGSTPGLTHGTQGLTRGTLQSRPMRPLAPVPTAERALAVLPFRYIGPPEQSYLGDGLADELIDALSRTRGLRVLGSGATSKYRTDRDARAVGADLGVDAVVDATVQFSAKQVRVNARLIEVATGTQLWSDKFENGLEDLFELQDRISKRIAEALRVELSTAGSLAGVSAEAVALYMRGRRKLMGFQVMGTDGAIELLEACLAEAPGLQPAIACHAIACMRAWFVPSSFATTGGGEPRNWEAEAKASVARAAELAPELAETQLARGMLAVQTGAWKEAVQALVKALEIAPTYAHAHQYLAQLQCEAGNTKEGIDRARLAFDLEPNLLATLFDISRVHALRGDREEADKYLDMIDRNARFRNPTAQFRCRIAGWYGDIETVRDILDSLNPEDNDGFGQYVIGYARAIAGEATRAEVDVMARRLIETAPSPRFYTLMCQACTEIYAVMGDAEEALAYYVRAADSVLVDIEWTDRCPSLKAMRALPAFAEARRKVRRRVQAMWSL